MTYNGKTVVSVSWGANISGVTDNNLKNVDVLFDDNSTLTMTYARLLQTITGITNQQTNNATQATKLATQATDSANLKALFVSTLGFTA